MHLALYRIQLAILLSMVCTLTHAKDHVLSGAELRDRLAGRTITDGTHWSYVLNTDGRVSAIDMGKNRSGVWRISAGELCIRVPVQASEDCWSVRQRNTQFFLVREGGAPIEITVEPAPGTN